MSKKKHVPLIQAKALLKASDQCALIRTRCRSTPHPSVSIITVWKGHNPVTVFLWSSAIWGVKDRKRGSIYIYKYAISKGQGETYCMGEMPERFLHHLCSSRDTNSGFRVDI